MNWARSAKLTAVAVSLFSVPSVGITGVSSKTAANQQIACAEIPNGAPWLKNWLSSHLPGQHMPAKAATRALANPDQKPLTQDRWLKNWLNGELPGKPKSSPPKTNARTAVRATPAARFTFKSRRSPIDIIEGHSNASKIKLPEMSLSIGTVLTTGKTTWNHDATSSSALLGNPSSELTYSGTIDLALELGAEFRK